MDLAISAESALSPDEVIARAGTDFSVRRAAVWTNVNARRLHVHEHGPTHVEVTEYATGIGWFAWERTRYDWSEPGSIKQVVLDSNVLEPGSTWELRVMPRTGGGSAVHMTFARRFRLSLAGAFGWTVNHLFGRPGWGWYLRSALRAIERPPLASLGHGPAPGGCSKQ